MTLDATHTQDATARRVVHRGAHYVMTAVQLTMSRFVRPALG